MLVYQKGVEIKIYKIMELRKFNSMSSVLSCFEHKTSPMMRITAFGGVDFFQTKAEKLNALKERKETEKFTIAWAGKWATDVFEVNENDIEEILDTYEK